MKRFRVIQIAILLQFVLFGGGCASMPFGTMLRLSTYGWEDLADARPTEIRAAFKVPADVGIDPASAVLHATLGASEATPPLFAADASLVLEESGQRVITPLPPAPDGFHWFVFALDDAGVDAFRRFQDRLLEAHANGENVTGSLSAHAQFDGLEHYDRLPMSVWMKLAHEDDWFALVEDAAVAVERSPGEGAD